MKLFSSPTSSFDPFASRNLHEWREYILEGILRGILVICIIGMLAGINNVYQTYQAEVEATANPLFLAISTLTIYVGTTALLTVITFAHKLPFTIRAGSLLFIFYALGSIGLVQSSFSGDGRIFLFAFVILSAVFFDLRYSLTAFFTSLATMIVIGWLQVNGYIIVPPARQINSVDVGAWVSGVAVFLILSIAILISITYLLGVLGRNLERLRELLAREQNLGRMLRTLSDINQLIVREQDQGTLLFKVCQRLVSGRSYASVWIGLLEADGITLKLAASAGETIDPELFTIRLDQEEANFSCVAAAIRSRTLFQVDATAENDPCLACPRRGKCPQRSAIALPLLRDERIFGVLVVDHTSDPKLLSDEESQLLQELADDLAYALGNLEVNNRLQTYARHQALLNEITQTTLETPGLEAMLERLIAGLEKALSADGFYFSLWNESTQQPMKFISSDAFKDILSLYLNLTHGEKIFCRSVLESGHILAVEDVRNTIYISPHLASMFPIHSALGLPLIANDRKLGTLVFGFREHHFFSTDEIELAGQAARQIALSIVKAELDADIRTKATELEQLYAAAQDMAASIMDPPELLAKLAHHMTENLQVTSGNIMAINLADGTMQVVGEYLSEFTSPLENHMDLGKVYQNSEYMTIVNAMQAGEVIIMHEDDAVMTTTEHEQFVEYGIKSMMFVPIMAHGQLFGNIELWESRRRREFTQTDIRLAKAMAGHAASVIENASLVNALRSSETRYRTLVEQASDGIFLADSERRYMDVNPSGCAMLGYSREELLTMHMEDIAFSEELSITPFKIDDLRAGKTVIMERLLKRKDGSPIPVEISARMLPSGFMQGIVRDISERKQAEKALAEREAYFRALIENSTEGVAIIDAQGIVRYLTPSEERLTGYTVEEVMGESAFKYIHPNDLPNVLQTFSEGAAVPGAVRSIEYRLKRKDGEWRYFEITGHNMLDDPHIAGIVVNYRDVTERKLAEQALQESRSRLEAIITTAMNGIITIDGEQRIVLFNPSAERIFGYSAKEVLGQRHEKLIPQRYQLAHASHVEEFSATGKTARRKGMLDSLFGLRANGEEFPMEAFISQSEVGGQKLFTVIFQDITERKRAEEGLRRHATELEILTAASSALRTAQNVTEMIPILARHALRAVNGTYASIFLLDAETGDFVSHGWYPADESFKTQSSDEYNLRHLPGEGITGRVVMTDEIYVTEDIHKDQVVMVLDGEEERLRNVHGGISLPLRTQDNIIGVLHIWSVESRIFSDTDIRLLIALAESASNAIHRAVLFEQTLKHADELALAYDNTLAGWARALELRDELTEGHTRRVTELTLRLAHALHIPEDEIVNIRRGALLHDIGKMGIPDAILQKPGAFTAQERKIMQQHTQYAYDMLATIPFLQTSIDIPWCHHEYWNGEGYPRGLKGEEIPLSARIFSVVDVWDALTSDRPYRSAWTKEKTRQYILNRSGIQFDPHVTEVFFSLMFD